MLHRREEDGDRWMRAARVLASFASFGAVLFLRRFFPRSTSFEAHRHRKTWWNSGSPTRERMHVHMHAGTHARTHADIAVRRVRGLPGTSQLSFRVINDMRSYHGTYHPVPRGRGVLTSYRIPHMTYVSFAYGISSIDQ